MVQADPEVEGVLAALRLRLHELGFDGVEGPLRRRGRPRILACIAQPVHRAVVVVEQVAELLAQRELRVEILLRRRDARVLHDGELRLALLAVDIEADGVCAGRGDATLERTLQLVHDERLIVDPRGLGIPHLPHEPIHPGLDGDARLLVLGIRVGRTLRERPDGLAATVQECEGDVLRRGPEEVRHDDAVRRVLPRVEMELDLLAVRLLLDEGRELASGRVPVVLHRGGFRLRAEAGVGLVPDGGARRKEPGHPRGPLARELADRREVVEDPERAPVRREREVPVLDDEIVERHDRQRPALPPVPPGPTVVRDVEADFGPRVEEAGDLRVLADRSHERIGRDAGGDLRPSAAIVLGLVDVRTEVVVLVAVGRDVGGAGVVLPRLDDADQRLRGNQLGCDVRPLLRVVARDVDEPVVAAGPEHAGLHGRLGEREDRGVILGAGLVERDRAAGVARRALVVAREVRAHPIPGRTVIARAMHVLRRGVEDARVMRREEHRRGPVEAVLDVLGRDAARRLGPHVDGPDLAAAPVQACQQTGMVRREHDVGVVRPHRDVSSLTTADLVALGPQDPAQRGSRRRRDRGVVLLRGVQPVGGLGVRGDVVVLGRRLVVDARPRRSAIE